jgi:methyl-accepting chemotaxis protein
MPETIKSSGLASGYGVASRLSLAAKLYSVFALFALLTAVITALSGYSSRRNTELTEAIETANSAALNVERVNSLVYAIVMESRGVYMSTEAAVVKKYGAGLLKFNDQIGVVVKNWQSLVQADDSEQFAVFKKRIEQFIDFRKELVRRGIEIDAAAGREWGDNDANRAVRSALNKDLEALSKVYAERGKRIVAEGEFNRELAFLLTCLGGLALVVVGIGVLIISRSVARPLSLITATIKQVAEGADHVEVPHTERADEIGALARAIQIFKEAMDRNRNLNAQALLDAKAREERARHIEASVETFRSAIGGVLRAVTDLVHAPYRAVHRQGGIGCQRPRRRRRRRDRTGLRQCVRRGQCRRGTVGFGGGDRPASPSIRRRGRTGRCPDREVGRRDRESGGGDPAHRRRAHADPGDRGTNQSAGAQCDDRSRPRRRGRARLRRGGP